MTMLDRLFPARADNRFDGHRSALWLLGVLVALRLIMSVNSIVNTPSIVVGADGFPIDRYGAEGAQAVLMLFALAALAQLALALVGLAVLVRYRALAPLFLLLILAEQLVRRAIIQAYGVPRSDSIAPYIGWGMLLATLLALALSLMPARRSR